MDDYAPLITDSAFKTYCLAEFDNSPQDGRLSYDEVMAVTTIDLFLAGITVASLEGIRYFKNLETLVCDSNQLTGSLDVSGLTALTQLYCNDNQLTGSLDVSGLTALTELHCYGNNLTELNISELTALTTLYCDNNQLTELDVSGLTALETLFCDSNQLTELDVSGNGALTNLYCGNEGNPPLTVWVDSGHTLGSGANELNIIAVRLDSGITYYDPITERDDVPVNGVTVTNKP